MMYTATHLEKYEILKDNNQLVRFPEEIDELNDKVLFRSVLTIDTKYDLKSKKHRDFIINMDEHIRYLETTQNDFMLNHDEEGIRVKRKVKYPGINKVYHHNISLELINLLCLRSFYIILGDYQFMSDSNEITFNEILNTKSLHGADVIVNLERLVINNKIRTKLINEHIDYLALNTPYIIHHVENTLSHNDIDFPACIFKANRLIGDNMVSNISRMGQVIGTHIGASVDLIEIAKIKKNNPEIAKIMDHVIKTENKDMPVIEHENQSSIKRFLTLLGNTDTNYARLLGTAKGNEIYQLLVKLGNRPDMKGFLYPSLIQNSFIDGITPKDFFIQANSSRKFQQINASQISKSGYLQRKFNLAGADKNVMYPGFCGSINPLHIVIPTMKRLIDKFRGRNCFIMDKNGTKQDIYIPEDQEEIHRNYGYYKQLINRDIYFYSTVSCAHEDGYCEKCLGFIYNYKYVSHALYCGSVFASQIGNKLLGTKHLIVTNGGSYPNLAGFPDMFGNPSEAHAILNSLFINNGQYMIPMRNLLSIRIPIGGIKRSSFIPYVNEVEFEYMDQYGEVKLIQLPFYGNNKIYLSRPLENFIDFNRKSNTVHYVDIKEFIDFSNMINGDSSFNTMPLFYTLSKTPETTDTVYAVLNIIDSKSRDGISITDMYYQLSEALENSGIHYNSTHIEMILSILISSSYVKGKRPNFKKHLEVSDYRWVNIDTAIQTSATSSALGYEDHKNVISSPNSYNRSISSLNDILFTGTGPEHLRKVCDANSELFNEISDLITMNPAQLALVKGTLSIN